MLYFCETVNGANVVHFSRNMSCKGTGEGKAKENRKQKYLPKGILVSDVQELFEYLTRLSRFLAQK